MYRRMLSAMLAALLLLPSTALATKDTTDTTSSPSAPSTAQPQNPVSPDELAAPENNTENNTPAPQTNEAALKGRILYLEAMLPEGYDATKINADLSTTQLILRKRMAGYQYISAENSGTEVMVLSDHSIAVTLPPTVVDAEEAAKKLLLPAKLSIQDEDGVEWMSNADISGARAGSRQVNSTTLYYLELQFTPDGATKFAQITEQIAAREDGKNELVIQVDGITYAHPLLRQKIESTSCLITNNFTQEQTEELALLLDSGALPFGLRLDRIEDVKDTSVVPTEPTPSTSTNPAAPTTPTTPTSPTETQPNPPSNPEAGDSTNGTPESTTPTGTDTPSPTAPDPATPDKPAPSTTPTTPDPSTTPPDSTNPANPTTSTTPTAPDPSTTPTNPENPTNPATPATPTTPDSSTTPTAPENPTAPTTPDSSDKPGTTDPAPTSPTTTPTQTDPATATDSSTEPVEYADIQGHWAQEILEHAIQLDLLKGRDGNIQPDAPMKYSEAIVMLNRILGSSGTSDVSGLPEIANAWYKDDVAKALHSGFIDAQTTSHYTAAMTRAKAFELLARAFVFVDADNNISALQNYSDTGTMTEAQKSAAAILISKDIINGNSKGQLRPDGILTRAEFVSMLLRIVSDFHTSDKEVTLTGGGKQAIAAPSAVITDSDVANQAANELFAFGAPVRQASLSNLGTVSRVSMKGMLQTILAVSSGTNIQELALDAVGNAQVAVDDTSSVGTLFLAGTGGSIAYRGKTDTVEITASKRSINLSNLHAKRLIISGTSNTLVVNDEVEEIIITRSAGNTWLSVNGKVGTVTISGIGSTLNGSGHATTIQKNVASNITLANDSLKDNVDKGLSNVKMILGHPTHVNPGEDLLIVARFENLDKNRICKAQWYQDGKPLERFSNDQFKLYPTNTSRVTLSFEFKRGMQTNTTVGLVLYYDNPDTGKQEKLMEQVTVPIHNYSDEWYIQQEAGPVLEKVSSTYRGNYTAAYAINNDYTQHEKELFVNAKGYSSNSKYLLWINRAFQHVNVFTGSKTNWKLEKSFLVGTGAAGTATPVGVTTVSYKSAAGWTTGTYTVRPVVGFYPGTGYAFHSRLCYPGTDNEYDYSGGYPVSHGCVRMNKADVKWIYNNVPVGTTVVIF